MNKFIAVTAILMMTGISSYVFAQTVETKPSGTKPAAITTAAPATATPPVVKSAASAAVSADTNAMINGMQQGGTIITRGGNVIMLPRRGACDKRENGAVEITFQYAEDDVADLSKEIDARVANVKSEAAKAGATADMTDLNYNVNAGRNMGYNPDGDNAKYHINGSMHFNVTPADKAVVMLQALSAGKDHVSLNYRMTGGTCGMIP